MRMGLKAAVGKVLHASWQRCRVHFMRNVLAHAGKHGRRVVAAFIATAFAQEDAEMARSQWRQVADQLRPKVAKLAVLMDAAEADVLAFMSFPKDHRPKIHSTNPRRSIQDRVSFAKEALLLCQRKRRGSAAPALDNDPPPARPYDCAGRWDIPRRDALGALQAS